MKITLAFTQTHARSLAHFLQQKYGRSKNTSLETLAKIAVLTEAARQAQAESDQADSELNPTAKKEEWHIRITGSRSGILIEDSNKRVVAIVNLHTESTAWGDTAMFKEENRDCLDNAQIIAATHDMLRALESQLSAFSQFQKLLPLAFNTLEPKGQKAWEIMRDACAMSERALAKAAGK